MNSKARYFQIFGLAAFLLPLSVDAHPLHIGAAEVGFLSGIIHPLESFDHILTMLAVGLWLSRSAKQTIYLMPWAFVVLMLIGGGLIFMPVDLVHAEIIMNLSVLLLSLMLAFRFKASLLIEAIIGGNIMLFHGYVHAYDIWLDEDALAYTAGFAMMTAMLMATGIVVKNRLLNCLEAKYPLAGRTV
ncbi:HupE/UreJ family protein [Methylomonas fluvii]|uniref:HupE/UreJ family protein n=1 Tax=Methylomonas fluvii TaxID=1854564 RepID=A0ABR9DKY4_9GAMM|nr:HupE/UreJ family protein [Methylomonas fluvii]MBD9363737.1 HupE/UreJ family protein [Methylomonas fluvii]